MLKKFWQKEFDTLEPRRVVKMWKPLLECPESLDTHISWYECVYNTCVTIVCVFSPLCCAIISSSCKSYYSCNYYYGDPVIPPVYSSGLLLIQSGVPFAKKIFPHCIYSWYVTINLVEMNEDFTRFNYDVCTCLCVKVSPVQAACRLRHKKVIQAAWGRHLCMYGENSLTPNCYSLALRCRNLRITITELLLRIYRRIREMHARIIVY